MQEPEPTNEEMNAAVRKFDNHTKQFSGTVTYKDKNWKTVTTNTEVYGNFLKDKAQNNPKSDDFVFFIKWVDENC